MSYINNKCNELRRDKLIFKFFEKFLEFFSVLGALVGKTAIDETLKYTKNSLQKYWTIAIVLMMVLVILYVLVYYGTHSLLVHIHKLENSCKSKSD